MSSRERGFIACKSSFFLPNVFKPSALFFLWLVLLSATVVKAQVLYGTITGNVTDTTSAVINGASVVALNTDTGVSRTVTTNTEGIYLIQDLQPGTYILTITAASFGPYRLTGVQVSPNKITRSDAQLRVGTNQQAVEVNSQSTSPAIRTASTITRTMGATISIAAGQ